MHSSTRHVRSRQKRGNSEFDSWKCAVRVLVKHLQAPPVLSGDDRTSRLLEHEVEKGSAYALGLLSVKPMHQRLIVGYGALPHLVDLLKRHEESSATRAVISLIRRAADAITILAYENSSIKNCVRTEGGIPPLVKLLNFNDSKVQRAAAGALCTLASKDDKNKDEVAESSVLKTLIKMLQSDDAAICYEAVGVIENLLHSSSPIIKSRVLSAGALPHAIRLLKSCCLETQREAALLLGHFAADDPDRRARIVGKGALPPLIELLRSPDVQLREMSAFVLGRLAMDTHNVALTAFDDALVPLLELLDSEVGSLQRNAAFALYGLADDDHPVSSEIIKVGGVQKLRDGVFILKETKHTVARTLRRLEKRRKKDEKIHASQIG